MTVFHTYLFSETAVYSRLRLFLRNCGCSRAITPVHCPSTSCLLSPEEHRPTGSDCLTNCYYSFKIDYRPPSDLLPAIQQFPRPGPKPIISNKGSPLRSQNTAHPKNQITTSKQLLRLVYLSPTLPRSSPRFPFSPICLLSPRRPVYVPTSTALLHVKRPLPQPLQRRAVSAN